LYYRYISNPAEVVQVKLQRRVQTVNPVAAGTWYSPTLYDDPDLAWRELAMPYCPIFRIGPIHPDLFGSIVHPLRPVAADFHKPGGGWEICIQGAVYVGGLWDFGTSTWS
jgi:hypothetical protein